MRKETRGGSGGYTSVTFIGFVFEAITILHYNSRKVQEFGVGSSNKKEWVFYKKDFTLILESTINIGSFLSHRK